MILAVFDVFEIKISDSSDWGTELLYNIFVLLF